MEAWEPSDEEPWDNRRASLLHRRAGFAATQEELRATLSLRPEEVVAKMVHSETANSSDVGAFESDSAELAKAVLATSDVKQLAAWWLHRMLNTPTPLVEKMTLFWHGHFATGAEKVQDAELMRSIVSSQVRKCLVLSYASCFVSLFPKMPAIAGYITGVQTMTTVAKLCGSDFDSMVERGAFDSLKPMKIELIHGELRFMNPARPIHEGEIEYLTRWACTNTDSNQISIRVQSGINCGDHRPEPDLAWIRRLSSRRIRPTHNDVLGSQAMSP